MEEDRKMALRLTCQALIPHFCRIYEQKGGNPPPMALIFTEEDISQIELPEGLKESLEAPAAEEYLEHTDYIATKAGADAVAFAYKDEEGVLNLGFVVLNMAQDFFFKYRPGYEVIDVPFPPHILQQYRTLRDFSVASKDIPAGSC